MPHVYRYLIVDSEDEIAWVTINRAKDGTHQLILIAELHRFLDRIERTSARAVVFTGSGDTHFIGGADGVEMMLLDPEGAYEFSTRIQGLFNRMEQSRLILTAAINGLCFGGGYEFALACDFRIAARTGTNRTSGGEGRPNTRRRRYTTADPVGRDGPCSGNDFKRASLFGEKACKLGLFMQRPSLTTLRRKYGKSSNPFCVTPNTYFLLLNQLFTELKPDRSLRDCQSKAINSAGVSNMTFSLISCVNK